MRKSLLLVAALLVVAGVASAESLVTVRVGEQDTCDITGVTAVQSDRAAKKATIRFDLSKLQDAKVVKRAVLRLWVNMYHRDPMARYFAIERWNEEGFDGFKVWDAAAGGGDSLDTVYPFACTLFACHEWDVTKAVAKWLNDPATNKGLKTNVPLPKNAFKPAWLRPYLQITYAGPNTQRPKQPTELKALYRSGQIFLTWKQVPHKGAFFDSTYRVYAHTAPITAANLDKARLLGEVNRMSQFNYRRTAFVTAASFGSYVSYRFYGTMVANRSEGTRADWRNPDWIRRNAKVRVNGELTNIKQRYNFVIDDTWREKFHEGKWLKDVRVVGDQPVILQGPELSDDTGLFVHTVTAPGKVYYAVTAVLEGNENRTDFSGSNALKTAIETKVAPPKPVPQVAYLLPGKTTYHHYRMLQDFAHWGGGEDGLHNEPSTPFYFRVIPHSELVNPAKRIQRTGPFSSITGRWWGTANLSTDNFFVPPTRLAPFPPTVLGIYAWSRWNDYYHGAADGSTAKGGIVHGHKRAAMANQFGYHDRFNTGRDPRKATMLDCFEKRFVREVEYYFEAYPKTSRDHLSSVGEGAAVLIGIHHPDKFAFVGAGQFVPWSAKRMESQWMFAGKKEWDLLRRKPSSCGW